MLSQLVDIEFELYKSYQVSQHGEQADEVSPSVQQACCTEGRICGARPACTRDRDCHSAV